MTTKQGTKADLQKIITFLESEKKKQKQEHQEELTEIIDIFGSFLDLIFLMKDLLPKSDTRIIAPVIDQDIRELQKRFYRIASLNGLSILTPSQKKVLEKYNPDTVKNWPIPNEEAENEYQLEQESEYQQAKGKVQE